MHKNVQYVPGISSRVVGLKTLEKTEGTITNGHSRDTDNIGKQDTGRKQTKQNKKYN